MKWIRFNEEKPREGTRALFWQRAPRNRCIIGYRADGIIYTASQTYSEDWFTHWMPLPKQPKD